MVNRCARPCAACCDLTKRGERVFRGPLDAVCATLGSEAPLRGEWVLVVGGAAPAAADAGFPEQADVLIAELRARGLGARDIRDVVVATFGTGKKETYQRVLGGSG